MVKPDFYGVKGAHEIAMILPQASEEYGPIAFYYLIVVPEDKVFRNPDQYLTEDVSVFMNTSVILVIPQKTLCLTQIEISFYIAFIDI